MTNLLYEVSTNEFTAFWVRDGAVAAALNVNAWDDDDALQDLVDTSRRVAAAES